jgi:hypothetical protein
MGQAAIKRLPVEKCTRPKGEVVWGSKSDKIEKQLDETGIQFAPTMRVLRNRLIGRFSYETFALKSIEGIPLEATLFLGQSTPTYARSLWKRYTALNRLKVERLTRDAITLRGEKTTPYGLVPQFYGGWFCSLRIKGPVGSKDLAQKIGGQQEWKQPFVVLLKRRIPLKLWLKVRAHRYRSSVRTFEIWSV